MIGALALIVSTAAGEAARVNPEKCELAKPEQKDFDWLIVIVLAEALIPATAIGALVYCIIRISFASNGVKW